MSKLSKILVTIVVIVLFLGIFTILSGVASSSGGHVPGVIGLIIFGGMFGAIRAIWKKNKPNEDNNDNKNNESGMLQK